MHLLTITRLCSIYLCDLRIQYIHECACKINFADDKNNKSHSEKFYRAAAALFELPQLQQFNVQCSIVGVVLNKVQSGADRWGWP